MPNVLLLRFAAPMQSWGVSSRFSRRDTGKEPSKSGVVGLLCAALGIGRDAAQTENQDFREIVNLKMGVRVIREGVLQSDYHTAQNIAKADSGLKETELSTRFYLADADFLVGLEADDAEILERLQKALENPRWQIFLGRKSFAPHLPVYFAEGVFRNKKLAEFIRSAELDELLQKYDAAFDRAANLTVKPHRLILEDEDDGTETRQDVPLSFAARKFTTRRVATSFIDVRKGEKENADSII